MTTHYECPQCQEEIDCGECPEEKDEFQCDCCEEHLILKFFDVPAQMPELRLIVDEDWSKKAWKRLD